MTVEEIYLKGEISVRSYHVCITSELYTVFDLINFYHNNLSFKNIRNCGTKSNNELIAICEKYKSSSIKVVKRENIFEKIVLNLSRAQREVINSFTLVNKESLSVRSNTAISSYLNNNFKVKNFTEKILIPKSFHPQNMKNIGTKSVTEINNYISIVKEFILEVNKIKDEKLLIKLKNKFLIQRTFDISNIPNSILESESIFQLTEFLINQNAFFNEIQTVIIKNSLKLYNNQEEVIFNEISKQVGLTRERIRQIIKSCLDNLLNKLLFIQNFNDDLFRKYNIDVDSMYIEVSSNLVDEINNSNNTNFSREFITYIIFAYLNEDFKLIGNYKDVLQLKRSKYRSRHNWNNIYIIRKELVSEIEISYLMNDISKRIHGRIQESYCFNFKSYLSEFLKSIDIDSLVLLLPVYEKVINEEFEIYLDLDENIIFKRNTIKQVYEYAFEALETLGKPSKVKEIFEKVKELNSDYDTNESKIRASMKRKYGFVPIGRKSVFGLKKWESKLENFKGGTIRSIVEEYLLKYSVPVHISHITEHVLNYRPKSNQNSILHNLKLDESGQFRFYYGSLVGLTKKKYDEKYKELSKNKRSDRKTWEESFEMLQHFISIKNRLPFSGGLLENEVKLYRWLNVQKKHRSQGKLTQVKVEKLNKLLENYPDFNTKRRRKSNRK